MEQTTSDCLGAMKAHGSGKSIASTDEPGTPDAAGSEQSLPLHLPKTGANAEGTGPEVFWGGRRRASLVRRLERRCSEQQPSAPSSDSVDGGLPRGWQQLRDIFGQLAGVSESENSDSGIEGNIKTGASESKVVDELVSNPALPGGFMEPQTDVVALSGWQRLRRIVRDLGDVMDEGLNETRQLLDQGSAAETAGAEVFWTTERSSSLRRRLEQRLARRGEVLETTFVPDDERSEAADTSSSFWSLLLQGVAEKVGGGGSEVQEPGVEEGSASAPAQSSTAGDLNPAVDEADVPDEQVGEPADTSSSVWSQWLQGVAEKIGGAGAEVVQPGEEEQQGNSQIHASTAPGQTVAWRSSLAVAAGRSPLGLMLTLRKFWRELGMPLEDADGQLLVECLCEPEGPWPPLTRRLPLSQVVGCCNALWEAENLRSAA